MVKYIEDNVLLCHNQHGFRSGRSCLTQPLSHFDDVMLGYLQVYDTDLIYLDYNANMLLAFNKLDHNLELLEKLKRTMDFHNSLLIGYHDSSKTVPGK